MLAKDLKAEPPKIIIYGPPGTGKSASLFTCGSDLEVLELDRGQRTVLYLKDQFFDQRQRAEVYPCWELHPKQAIAWPKALARLLEISDACFSNPSKYQKKVVAIDSFSAAAEFALRYIRVGMGGIGQDPGSWTSAKTRQLFDGRQIYGMAMEELKNMLTILRSLPIAVILIAHAQRDEMDGVQIEEIGTYGKRFPAEIPKYFDEVFYSHAYRDKDGKQAYGFKTVATETRIAKSRTSLPADLNQNLGMPQILKMMGWEINP